MFNMGDILEKKCDKTLAKIEEIRINSNGTFYVINFDNKNFDLEKCDVISETELEKNWKKANEFMCWKINIKENDLKNNFASRFADEYGEYTVIDKGVISLIKRNRSNL